MNLKIADIKTGDYIECGNDINKLDIWKVQELTFHTVGAWKDQVKDLIMINKEGKKKHYAFLEKDIEFLNSKHVTGYKYNDLENGLIALINEIMDENIPPTKKLNKIKELIR